MNKDGDVWRITVNPLADEDMRTLKRNNPDAFKRMMTALKTLQRSPNVFELPPNFDICYTYPDADNCLRFKVNRDCWRVVIRLMIGDCPVRITPESRPCAGNYLQIVFVDARGASTYVRLAARMLGV